MRYGCFAFHPKWSEIVKILGKEFLPITMPLFPTVNLELPAGWNVDELICVSLSILALSAYHVYYYHNSDNLRGFMVAIRESWIRQNLDEEKNTTVELNTLRNSLKVSGGLSSTAMLICAATTG